MKNKFLFLILMFNASTTLPMSFLAKIWSDKVEIDPENPAPSSPTPVDKTRTNLISRCSLEDKFVAFANRSVPGLGPMTPEMATGLINGESPELISKYLDAYRRGELESGYPIKPEVVALLEKRMR